MNFKFLILSVFILTSCSVQEPPNNRSYIPIDFEQAIDREIKLESIADSIKFTFLEYDKKNIVGKIKKFKITRKYILVVDQQEKLFVFKRNGELLSTIHNRGKGPSEYVSIEDFSVDPNEEHIFILASTNGKVLKYTTNGLYENEYSIDHTHAAHLSSLLNGNYCIYQSARFSKEHLNLFITDANFTVTHSFKDPNGIHLRKLPYLLDVHWYKHNNNIYYKEVLGDTVFCINESNTPQPHIFLNFGKKKMPDKYYTKTKYYQMGSHKFYQLGEILESDNFIFMYIIYNHEKEYFLYEKNKNRLLMSIGNDVFTDGRKFDLNFWPEYIEDNTMYSFVNAGSLYNKLGNTRKENELKHILNLNDNPVLLSCKLLDK